MGRDIEVKEKGGKIRRSSMKKKNLFGPEGLIVFLICCDGEAERKENCPEKNNP